MADYGLLSGLAQGLNAGLDAYNSAKERQAKIDQIKYDREVKGLLMKQQQEKAEKDRKLDLYKAGATESEGEIIPDVTSPYYGAQESRQRYQDAMSQAIFGKEAIENARLSQQERLANQRLEQERELKQQDFQLRKEQADKNYSLNKEKLGLLAKKGSGAGTGAGGGKMLPPSMVAEQSSAKYINDVVLKDLGATLKQNESILGPAEGLVGKGLGFLGVGDRAEKQRKIQSELDAAVQEIGKFLEGGKLAEGDLARYRQMAPQVTDPPNVAQQKLINLSKLVAEKQRASLEALKASGYNVGGIKQAERLAPQDMSREEKLKRLRELEGK